MEMTGEEYRRLIGTRMRAQRERIGLNKSQFAKAVGSHVSIVSKWEDAIALPQLRRFPTVARVLRTTLDALLNDPDPEEKAS